MRFLTAISLFCGLSAAAAGELRMTIQRSPLAGSQYHALAEVRAQLKVGDALSLVREPGNRHDANAIRIDWRGRPLGYVPRAANRALAAALDRGEPLSARISRLGDDADPWRRLEFEVLAGL